MKPVPQLAGVLNRAAIAALVKGYPPLVNDYPDLERQLQPNGFDLTLRTIAPFSDAGAPGHLGTADGARRRPALPPAEFAGDGWISLAPGSYLITFNEAVNLPRWLMALGRPRSSLLRSGVALHTAVWDAGYAGRSQALLVVHANNGWNVQRNARIAQLVFLPLVAPDAQGYAGRYQHENL